MARLLPWTIVAAWLSLLGVVAGLALSNEGADISVSVPGNVQDEGRLSESDHNQILELQEQIFELQQAVAEVTRSFSTLNLIAKNPAMMARLNAVDQLDLKNGIDRDIDDEAKKARFRRDVDSPLALPTTFPTPPNAQQSTWNRNQLGPYSWPLFSGQCFLCPAGVPGPRGPPGQQGMAGRDGRDGRDATGQLEGNLRQEVPAAPSPTNQQSLGDHTAQQLVYVNATAGGAVYIRWGHSECPDSAELIYTGTAGGAYYTHTGSGSNYLCMPAEPIYDEIETSANADRALLYSTEYQTSAAPDRLRSVHDHTPTCAVCRAPPGRTTQLMIPGRNVCPSDDWRLEYSGYLMAERYTHKRSEFICVDRELQAMPGTHASQDGALFYMVEGRCLVGGGLPCGPYVDGYELTCAVCTI